MKNQLTTSPKKLPESSTSNDVLAVAASRYGNSFITDFLPAYPTKHRGLVVKSLMDAVSKQSPSLASLDNEYPNKPSLFWLKYQLIEVFSYCGVYKNLTEYQIRRTAELIRHEYYWVTVTELMEFFTRFEAGKYRKMYGYNPQDLLQSLNSFAGDIQQVRGEYEGRLAAKKRRELDEKRTLTYEEWCELKNKKPKNLDNLIKKV